MRVRMFSHKDSDGYGCTAIATAVFGEGLVCSNVENNEVTDALKRFLDEEDYHSYDLIFITDISVPEVDLALVEKLNILLGSKLVLLDHHKTAVWLNHYSWGHVHVEKDGVKTSGTSLLFDYLKDNGYLDNIDKRYVKNIQEFAEVIRLYDTWDWKAHGNEFPNTVNTLFSLKGHKKFLFDLFDNHFKIVISKDDEKLLADRKEKYERLLEERDKELVYVKVIHNDIEYKWGVVYADSSVSLLGNDLAERHPEVDAVAIIMKKYLKVSVRTVKDIDCSEIVKDLYGGGGHPKSCGFGLDVAFVKMVELERVIQRKVTIQEKEDLKRVMLVGEDVKSRYKDFQYPLSLAIQRSKFEDVDVNLKELRSLKATAIGLVNELNLKSGKLEVILSLNGIYYILGGWRLVVRLRSVEESFADFVDAVVKEGKYGFTKTTATVIKDTVALS